MDNAKHVELVPTSSMLQLQLNYASHVQHQGKQSVKVVTSTILCRDSGEAQSIQKISISAGMINPACKNYPICEML